MFLKELVKFVLNARAYPKKLEDWSKTTTIDDIYEQFLHTAFHGHEEQWVPFYTIKPHEGEAFNATTSSFHTTPTGEIDLTDVFHFLCQAHSTQAPLIQSARPCLTALLYAHARFPFSKAVPLTHDALLRAIILLTHRGESFFRYEAMKRPKRNDRERLGFIFQTLAAADAGAGLVDHEAIIQVLVRMPFPTHPHKTFMPQAPKSGFEGMAKRLDPLPGESVEPFVISGEKVEPLAALVVGLQGGNTASEAVEFPLLETKDQFTEWGYRTGLLGTLDKVFEALLQPFGETKSGRKEAHLNSEKI